MSKYKILIFDLDDTQIDSTENIRYAFQQVIEGYQFYDEEKFNRWHRSHHGGYAKY